MLSSRRRSTPTSSLIISISRSMSSGKGSQISSPHARKPCRRGIVGQLAQSIGNALELHARTEPRAGIRPRAELIGQQVGKERRQVQQDLADVGTMNVILSTSQRLRLRTNILQGVPAQQSMFRRAESTGADLLSFSF